MVWPLAWLIIHVDCTSYNHPYNDALYQWYFWLFRFLHSAWFISYQHKWITKFYFYKYLSFFSAPSSFPISLCLVVVTVSSYAVISVHIWEWTNLAVTSCIVNLYLPYGVSSTLINSFQKHISKPSSHNSLLAILLKN